MSDGWVLGGWGCAYVSLVSFPNEFGPRCTLAGKGHAPLQLAAALTDVELIAVDLLLYPTGLEVTAIESRPNVDRYAMFVGLLCGMVRGVFAPVNYRSWSAAVYHAVPGPAVPAPVAAPASKSLPAAVAPAAAKPAPAAPTAPVMDVASLLSYQVGYRHPYISVLLIPALPRLQEGYPRALCQPYNDQDG